MKQKGEIYRLVKTLLENNHPNLGKMDQIKEVVWRVWQATGIAHENFITKEEFMKAPTPETITRCLRQVKKEHPHLNTDKERQFEAEEQYRKRYRTPEDSYTTHSWEDRKDLI